MKQKPIAIKKIILFYEDETRLIVNEGKTPIIGKLFFDVLEKHNVEWKIEEKKENKIKKKLQKFFSI